MYERLSGTGREWILNSTDSQERQKELDKATPVAAEARRKGVSKATLYVSQHDAVLISI